MGKLVTPRWPGVETYGSFSSINQIPLRDACLPPPTSFEIIEAEKCIGEIKLYLVKFLDLFRILRGGKDNTIITT